MKWLGAIASDATAVHAHYTFSALLVGGKSTGEWAAVRRSKNYLDNRPAMDVTSNDIRCYEFAPGTPAELTVNLTAGSTVAFKANPSIYHQGPLAFYMAKAPAEKTAATFDGSGDVWFKIWHEQPKFGEQLSWSSEGIKTPSVTIPKCIPDGDYLLRIEHIGLHAAQSEKGAQFYVSCAQITINGGGTATPGPKVALPGAYTPTDPGIMVNLNYPVPTTYINAGPEPFTC